MKYLCVMEDVIAAVESSGLVRELGKRDGDRKRRIERCCVLKLKSSCIMSRAS